MPCTTTMYHIPYAMCYIDGTQPVVAALRLSSLLGSWLATNLKKGAVDADVANSNSIGRLGAAMEGKS